MTDAELVRQTCDGEPLAREEFVRRWSPRVLAVCRAHIGRHHASEDLAQESLIRALTHLDQLDDPCKLGAWLRGIAVNVCRDWLRARPREQVSFSVLSDSRNGESLGETDDGIQQIERQERRQQIKSEIDALPDELREPLLLHYYDEITYEQIADILGVSRATVNTRLAKARRHLAKRLADEPTEVARNHDGMQ